MNNYCQERKLFQLSSELEDAVLCWVLLTAVFSSTEKLKGSCRSGRHIDQRARRELKGRCPLSKALLQDLPLPQEHPCTPAVCVLPALTLGLAGAGCPGSTGMGQPPPALPGVQRLPKGTGHIQGTPKRHVHSSCLADLQSRARFCPVSVEDTCRLLISPVAEYRGIF